jgi:hypothetical protein
MTNSMTKDANTSAARYGFLALLGGAISLKPATERL